jgi:hypothetical protein
MQNFSGVRVTLYPQAEILSLIIRVEIQFKDP